MIYSEWDTTLREFLLSVIWTKIQDYIPWYKLVRYMSKMMGYCNKKKRGKEFKIMLMERQQYTIQHSSDILKIYLSLHDNDII